MGLNRFANIYKHDYEEVMARHLQVKRDYIADARKTPACLDCLGNWQLRPYMYQDTEERVERFRNETFFAGVSFWK